MTDAPTVRLAIVINPSELRDEYYMLLGDDYTYQILSKLIPRLTLGRDAEICRMLGAEELNYLERTLSFAITDPRILKINFPKMKETKGKVSEITLDETKNLLEDFSKWIFKTLTSNSLLTYINTGLFDLEIIEFDPDNKYLMEAWTALHEFSNSLFCPSSRMVMDAVNCWQDDFLKILNIGVEPKENGVVRFTRLNVKGKKAVQPLSFTIH